MAHLMIDEMWPFTRLTVAVLLCQIGAITASMSAVVVWLTGFRPSLGNTYRSRDERQTFADESAALVRHVGSQSRITFSAACSNVVPGPRWTALAVGSMISQVHHLCAPRPRATGRSATSLAVAAGVVDGARAAENLLGHSKIRFPPGTKTG